MQNESTLVLREQVANAIRLRIIHGELAPSSGLGEERLAAELNVSRTPLREAIRQLTEEGFLEQSPRKGARVASLGPEMVREVFEVREALEGQAARLAALRMEETHIGRLRHHIERLRPRIEVRDYSDTGDCVHDEIVAACGNSRLQRLMSVYRGKVLWIQGVAFKISRRLDLAYREHDNIVSALECRDPDWAENAIRRHIRNTLVELSELLEVSGGRRRSA